MNISQQKSEVARLLKRIEEEYQCAQQALSAYAMTSSHALISARMENIGKDFDELTATLGSPEQAIALIAETLEHMPLSSGQRAQGEPPR